MKDEKKFDKDEKDQFRDRRSGKKGGHSTRGRSRKSVSTKSSGRSGRSWSDNRDSGSVTHTYNDPDWYNKNPIQVESTGNISFLNALGMPLDIIRDTTGITQRSSSAGGVMRCGYIPTYGNPQSLSDPMNVAAMKLYANIRQKNSGGKNYDAPDLMKYFVLMDSAFSYAALLTRIYGFVNSYSAANRFLPLAVFNAMDVDFDDIRKNIPQLRAYIDVYSSKVNSFAVPNTMPIIQRHFWMCSNVYQDGATAWAQCYVNMPEVYAVYDYVEGVVKFKALQRGAYSDYSFNRLKFTDLVAIGNEMVDGLLTVEDVNIISGDIVKAYGDALFKLSAVPAEYKLYPVYDAGVLEQIMNSRALGYLATDTTTPAIHEIGDVIYTLKEDTTEGSPNLGALQLRGAYQMEPDCSVCFLPSGSPIGGTTAEMFVSDMNDALVLINKANEQFAPIDIIETTRLSATAKYVMDTTHERVGAILDSCGVEVYTTYRTFHYSKFNGEMVIRPDLDLSLYHTFTDYGTSSINTLFMFNHWDWHPIIYTMSNGDTQLSLPYVDIYRPALVSQEVLRNMHNTANLSLFDITIVNSWI